MSSDLHTQASKLPTAPSMLQQHGVAALDKTTSSSSSKMHLISWNTKSSVDGLAILQAISVVEGLTKMGPVRLVMPLPFNSLLGFFPLSTAWYVKLGQHGLVLSPMNKGHRSGQGRVWRTITSTKAMTV